MADGNDLGKIVSLIMENPRLIEEISNLGKGKKQDSDATSEREDIDRTEGNDTLTPQATTQSSAPASVASSPADASLNRGGKNRSQLLYALKPYVSVQRAQAIDSMLSIVEILDAMKGR